MYYRGKFAKESVGIVYGSDTSDDSLKNIAGSGNTYGHAV